MVLGREKSVVRFQRGCSPSPNRRGNLPAPDRQKSDVKNRHRYKPRLHRQQTEQPPVSLLGAALKTIASSCRQDEEFFSPDRTSAREELKDIIDRSFVSLSRNSLGIQFLQPVHLMGFAHWQSYPEKRVITFLPVYISKLTIQPGDPGSAFIKLPRRFHSPVSINPSDLQSPHFSGRYLSGQRFFSVIVKIMKRILGLKSVSDDRIHASDTNGVLEIDLMDNLGWTGEVVFCLVMEKSDVLFYCRKPLFSPSDCLSNLQTSAANLTGSGEFEDLTPRSVVSEQSHSKASVGTKWTEENQDGLHGKTSTSQASSFTKQESSPNDTLTEASDVTSTLSADWEFDITWYTCQPRSENNLVRSISITDGGVRLTALLIVFKLLQHDWRLLPFSCYQIQAVMLHAAEKAVETSPRWQRNTLESCVRLLLRTLQYFVDFGHLPHFSVDNLDLWLYLSKKQLNLAKSALERLVQCDTALLSLARRTGRFGADCEEAQKFSDVIRTDVTSKPGLLKPIAH